MVVNSIDRALSGEASTLTALDFLQKIRTWIPGDAADNALENFVLLKLGEILNKFKEPLEDDVPRLLEAAHDYGGDDFLETVYVRFSQKNPLFGLFLMPYKPQRRSSTQELP